MPLGSSVRSDLYVQYGCGLCAPENWINFDASPTLRLQRTPILNLLLGKLRPVFPANVRYGNVVRGLPLSTNSVKGVYASHVLEHLSLEDLEIALVETFRILAPGGIFRAVVPDLHLLASRYVDGVERGDSGASLFFMRETYLGQERHPKSLRAFVIEWLGNSRHLWMWDRSSLSTKLSEHGFVAIRPAAFNDSEDTRFAEVEDEGRFAGACAIEARRPISS